MKKATESSLNAGPSLRWDKLWQGSSKLFFLLSLLAMFVTGVYAEGENITYFSCKVKEPLGRSQRNKTVTVTVKFAVQDLDTYGDRGSLIPYPGTEDEEWAPIFVKPQETIMSNLNSQGGDLTFEGSDLKLFGDGDGEQLTDLVIWDADDPNIADDELEGYVRDYGPVYRNADNPKDRKTFKQFIKCKRSSKVL